MVRSQHIILFFSVLNVFLVSRVSLRLLIVYSEGTNGGCEVMLMRSDNAVASARRKISLT